jgi:hypothetical protein
MFLVSVIAAASFAGVEPSPWMPIWRIIITMFGF